MSNIEKIKAEIERQLEYFKGKEDDAWDDCDKYTDEDAQWYQGHWKMCSRLLDFIDSLPEEKLSEDLEEAAEISFDEARALTEDYRDFLAKGLTENRPRPIGPHWFCEYAKNRFIAGAKWMKERMIKDAAEVITVQGSLTEPEFVKQRVIFLKEG